MLYMLRHWWCILQQGSAHHLSAASDDDGAEELDVEQADCGGDDVQLPRTVTGRQVWYIFW